MAISDNKMMYDLPHAMYVMILMEIGIKVKDKIAFEYQKLHVLKEGNTFKENVQKEKRLDNAFTLKLLTLEAYNSIQGEQKGLNEEQIGQFAISMHQEAENDKIYTVRFNLEGTEKQAETFINQLSNWCQGVAGFNSSEDIISWAKDVRAMNGGLLFLGIFFGIVFSVCLVLLMYYKQISEGFEDKKNFEVLKQVGMSDKEVRLTIRKQILIVFFLPLVVAIAHTFVGLHIVKNLLSILHLYNDAVILESSYGVILFFAVLYVVSYLMTSKAYYKIVK